MTLKLIQSKSRLLVHIYMLLLLLLPIGVTHAFDVQRAYHQWLTVKDGPDEADFLMKLFIEEQMYGKYPQLVRQRFRGVASMGDAETLLKQLIDVEQKDKQVSVYTLLKTFSGDEFGLLCEVYFYQAAQYSMRNKLFNLITQQNSLSAFMSATRALESLTVRGLNNESGSFLNYMVRFTQLDIRQAIIEGTQSSVDIIKAASFVALRNYRGADITAIIEQADSVKKK